MKTEILDKVLNEIRPPGFSRGNRLPLYLWPVTDIYTGDDEKTKHYISRLAVCGISVISAWNHTKKDESLSAGLKTAMIQKQLGLEVTVNANTLLHRFCNGDERTAHIDKNGKTFFDTTYSKYSVKMGCPFTLNIRYAEIKNRLRYFADAYKQKGITVHFVFADWEIDGAIEWGESWEHAKKCVRCRKNIPGIDDFSIYQASIREIRAEMQKQVFTDVMKSYFPDVFVGNYSVYPHNGLRYWYDYFESPTSLYPHEKDQGALYRKWYQEFPLTGYTAAMPVVYTWYPTFNWYNYTNPDYRWFYNMLLVASNAGENTPEHIPVIPFVHWHTTAVPADPDPGVRQMSRESYQELLWHMLLRKTSTFFLWCPESESVEEISLVHEVYRDSLEYASFLEKGVPITFDVPKTQRSVISGLKLNNQILVRRTDFTDDTEDFQLTVGSRTIKIPPCKGKCRIIQV